MPSAWTETAETNAFHARFEAVDVGRQERVEMATFMAGIKEQPRDDPGAVGLRLALALALGSVVLVGKVIAFVAEVRGITLGDGAFFGLVAGVWLLLLAVGALGLRAARGITVGRSLRTAIGFVFPTDQPESYVDQFRLELTADAFRVAGAHAQASTLRIPLDVVRGFGTVPKGIVVHGNDGRAYPLPCTLLDDDEHAPLARRLDDALGEIRAARRIAEADRGGYRGADVHEDDASAPSVGRMRR